MASASRVNDSDNNKQTSNSNNKKYTSNQNTRISIEQNETSSHTKQIQMMKISQKNAK